MSYFNEGNVDRLIAAYYAGSAVLASSPGQAASGSSLRTALQAYLDTRRKMKATTLHALVAGDTALLVSDGVDPAGKPLRITGTSTDVVIATLMVSGDA